MDKDFRAVVVSVKRAGETIKSNVAGQLASNNSFILLADSPKFSLNVRVGDVLEIEGKKFEVRNKLDHHCPFGSLPAHFDVEIQEV